MTKYHNIVINITTNIVISKYPIFRRYFDIIDESSGLETGEVNIEWHKEARYMFSAKFGNNGIPGLGSGFLQDSIMFGEIVLVTLYVCCLLSSFLLFTSAVSITLFLSIGAISWKLSPNPISILCHSVGYS